MSRLIFVLPAAAALLLAVDASADSGGPTLNPLRAYPPSCLALPLPQPAGPILSARVLVPTVDAQGNLAGSETVAYEFWRTPCNNGKSALLGAIVRDQSLQNTTPAPIFSTILGSQGGVQNHEMRVAAEPNTSLSYISPDQSVSSFIYFVFENDAQASFDFSSSIDLTVTNQTSTVTGTMPTYNPSAYADASLPLQISGYQTGNYFDTGAGGQGVQVEVADQTSGQRLFVFAWYTYDSSGTPYWLFNTAPLNVGDRSITLPLGYYSGAQFGSGNGNPAVWGNITVTFPDCDHMTVSYQSASGLPAGVPQGNGTKTFGRLTSINGVTCDTP